MLYSIEDTTITATTDKIREFVNNEDYNTEGISPTDLPNAVEEVHQAGYNLGKRDGMAESPVKSVNGKTGDVVINADDVGARPSTWTPTYSDTGAEQSGTAAQKVSEHNSSDTSHNDIRQSLKQLSEKVNAILDSDDDTLDELSEIVTYIKSNKTLINAITTSKVSVEDIVDDFVTNVTNKPLSAARGVALKALVDALDKDKLDSSELTNAINTALTQAKNSGEFDGKDYVLTSDDKQDIAELVLELIPAAEDYAF